MPVIAFMGVSYVQRYGGHIRMDMIIGKMRGRMLWAMEFFTVTLMLVVMIALIWGSWAHFDRSFDFSKPLWSRDSSIDIGIPMWPSKLLIPVAFGLLSVSLFLQAIGYGRAMVLDLEHPVAVPAIRSWRLERYKPWQQLMSTFFFSLVKMSAPWLHANLRALTAFVKPELSACVPSRA